MPKKSSATVYVGAERFQKIARRAREISYLTDSTITTGSLVNYIIDEYQEQAHIALLKTINDDMKRKK
ncbi:hypothetical protein HVH64_004505 [Salmonella enterica]|nr:hypothetical protein [Salmonella enterica]HBJ6681122.1 hypothetical protein [Salmonella enterica subsp. enterica serovar Muenchen]EFU0780395.1 hypothetical protein [Salmonella enterica]EJI8765815.1 hypothetical protein [Salmonella enterica]EKZ8200032.1 hypothetical protein [Salmonella enterica]